MISSSSVTYPCLLVPGEGVGKWALVNREDNFHGSELQEFRAGSLFTQPARQILLKLQPGNLRHIALNSICGRDKCLDLRQNHHCAPL